MNETRKERKRPQLTPEERKAAALEKEQLAAKKRQAAAEKKLVTEEKKRLAAKKRQESAEKKRREAAEKKRLAEEKKRLAEEKKRLAEEKKRLAEEKKRQAQRRATTPEAFLMALDEAVAADNQLVAAAELARHVERALKTEFSKFWSGESAVETLPAGVGSLRVKVGRKVVRKFFRLSDVQPSVGMRADRGGRTPLAPLKERLLAEFDRLNRQAGERFYVSLYDLRKAFDGIERADFDEALNQLRRDWVLTLNPAEGRHEQIPAHVLDAGISEQSKLLVYVSRREA